MKLSKKELQEMKKLKPASPFLLDIIQEVRKEFKKIVKDSNNWPLEEKSSGIVTIKIKKKRIKIKIDKLKTCETGILSLLLGKKDMKECDADFKKYLKGEACGSTNELHYVVNKQHAGKYLYAITMNPYADSLKETGIVVNEKGRVIKSQNGHIFFDPSPSPNPNPISEFPPILDPINGEEAYRFN